MKEVASQIGVTPPTSPTMVQQVEIKKLKGLDAAISMKSTSRDG